MACRWQKDTDIWHRQDTRTWRMDRIATQGCPSGVSIVVDFGSQSTAAFIIHQCELAVDWCGFDKGAVGLLAMPASSMFSVMTCELTASIWAKSCVMFRLYWEEAVNWPAVVW
uniref:Uncharacterized protein n=1 Tax=Anopheles melas TaxID=34690 RepID=A0A182UD22_9DIPT